ncbi:RlpA-like double-psi beta-barrel-protein domain-containing protein-containing protein [Trametes polyzona]|nr:RlpA-like double-psi beta-barrel-protein domain-containing protein-containing protein [Trametes polyzona]
MPFTRALVLLSVTLSVLAKPHIAHGNHHLDIAHRAAMPVSKFESIVNASMIKRADTRRCKARSSSAAPTGVPLNVESNPPAAAPTTTHAAPTTTPETTKHTTTDAAPPANTSKPPPSTGNGPSYLVGTQSGDGTFYDTGLTACGVVNKDSDYIAAVSHLLFDSFPGYTGGNPNNNPICGRKVTATYQGKSVTVAITDRCERCALTDLDFSRAAFSQIASFDAGRVHGMTWVWN